MEVARLNEENDCRAKVHWEETGYIRDILVNSIRGKVAELQT